MQNVGFSQIQSHLYGNLAHYVCTCMCAWSYGYYTYMYVYLVYPNTGDHRDSNITRDGKEHTPGSTSQFGEPANPVSTAWAGPVENRDRPVSGSQQTQSEESQRLMESTPTDEQIDQAWKEIETQLQARDKVSVVPQVYQFQPEPPPVGTLGASPQTGTGERVHVHVPQLPNKQLQQGNYYGNFS